MERRTHPYPPTASSSSFPLEGAQAPRYGDSYAHTSRQVEYLQEPSQQQQQQQNRYQSDYPPRDYNEHLNPPYTSHSRPHSQSPSPSPSPDPHYLLSSSQTPLSLSRMRSESDPTIPLTAGLHPSTSASGPFGSSASHEPLTQAERLDKDGIPLPAGWTKADEEAEREFLQKGMIDWKSIRNWRFWIRKSWWGE